MGRRHDIGDRVPGTDLVEGDGLHVDAVHAGLGLRQMDEDADGVVADRRREGGAAEIRADVGPRPVRVIVVMVGAVMVVTVVVPVRMGVRIRGGRSGSRDHEPVPGQDAVVVPHAFAGDPGDRCTDAGEHTGLVLREGVEEGRREHVARDPSEGVEMDLHALWRS